MRWRGQAKAIPIGAFRTWLGIHILNVMGRHQWDFRQGDVNTWFAWLTQAAVWKMD